MGEGHGQAKNSHGAASLPSGISSGRGSILDRGAGIGRGYGNGSSNGKGQG